MRNRWTDREAAWCVEQYGARWGEALALRTYVSRLLGVEPGLVLHGGGNASVKASWSTVLGEDVPAIFVKASGFDMAAIEPAGHPALDLAPLGRLRALDALDDAAMVNEVRRALFDAGGPNPSIETLVHAFLPAAFVDHTHADAILTLTNQQGGRALVAEALGDGVGILDYVEPGFALAKAVSAAAGDGRAIRGLVLMHHGLITWGESAKASYDAHIDLVTQAEQFIDARVRKGATVAVPARVDEQTWNRLALTAPILRGQLARATGDGDRPWDRVVLAPIVTDEMLALLGGPGAKDALVTPVLTTDHLIRTKNLPLWVDAPAWDDPAVFKAQVRDAVQQYAAAYGAYLVRHRGGLHEQLAEFDPLPRVVLLPGKEMERHSTKDNEEMLIFLKGTGRVILGTETITMEENQALYIPPQTEHEIHNDGPAELRYIYTVAPAGR